ncbi:hypothetical protein MPDQ_000078 [Monascus purpureus]|uniref:Alpha/beta hydrolase fold-3 domain-containing protein n=1 Tax=Monascus purpureus TaxID=5098 RepID=A0A507R4D5_MONPU|nr:hypothetical protein MPDQ_000078 [Monascus purpureus]BDD56642.1 hypothetical protein MAP00_002073 [Monascus purpureus]
MRILTFRSLRTLVFPRPGYSIPVRRPFVRVFSSTRFAPYLQSAPETVDVPVGSNGHVSLSVIQPSSPDPSSPPNVILYLPPGPLFQGPKTSRNNEDGNQADGSSLNIGSDDGALTPQQFLASITSSTVVTVNYRLGDPKEADTQSFYKYPFPIHDTLAGFDWIQQNLQPAQLGIFGTHIGGSLALMLALTEAQSIRAVAALEPICDWVGLDEYCTVSFIGKHGDVQSIQVPRRRKKRTVAPPDLIPLLEARERFFTRPERYFDAFASPILFLRASGRDVPKTFPRYLTGPEYPVPVLEISDLPERRDEHAALWDVYMQDEEEGLEGNEGEGSDMAHSVDEGKVVRRRKALSRWPPFGLDYGLSGSGSNRSSSRLGIGRLQMALPWVRIYAQDSNAIITPARQTSSHTLRSKGGSTVLAQQADEMVSVMRRACFWDRERSFGEERVQFIPVDNGMASVVIEEMAGEWLGDILTDTKMDADA